jgi:hypothetical protein
MALEGLPLTLTAKETVSKVQLGTSTGFYAIYANDSDAAVAQIASSSITLVRLRFPLTLPAAANPGYFTASCPTSKL